MAQHALLTYTEEVQIRIEASSPPELFSEAARALAELMAVPTSEPPGPWQYVDLDAPDREALLITWLNDLIVRSELDDHLYDDAQVLELSDHHVRARVRGRPILARRTAVRAASFHRVRIDDDGQGIVLATVTLDV